MKFGVWISLLWLLCTVPAHSEWLQQDREIMGTRVSVEIWAPQRADGQRIIEQVLTEFQRLDEMMNPWDENSELARLNREAHLTATRTTPEIIEVIERALHYSRLSAGAFDISFATVGQHYDYREARAPDKRVLDRDIDGVDYRSIALNSAERTLQFLHPKLQVDLGGIAKGYAVDRAIALLTQAGVESGVVSAGGDSRILGDLGDRPRMIGIRHPRKEGEYAVMIPLADTAISTSGDYERYFIADGVRYHHILDPKTGRSADGLQSASVLTNAAIDSDALSTTVFVLGVQRGLDLVNRLPGVDAILIDADGKLHYSQELLLSTTP